MINKQTAPRYNKALLTFLTFLLVNPHIVKTFSLDYLSDSSSQSDQFQSVRNVNDSINTNTNNQQDTLLEELNDKNYDHENIVEESGISTENYEENVTTPDTYTSDDSNVALKDPIQQENIEDNSINQKKNEHKDSFETDNKEEAIKDTNINIACEKNSKLKIDQDSKIVISNQNESDISTSDFFISQKKNISSKRNYQGSQVWRIFVQNNSDRQLANELLTRYGGQLWKEVNEELDFLLKPNALLEAEQYLQKLNLSRVVLIDDLQNMIDKENPSPEQISQLQNRKGHRLTWQAYHRLEDIYGFFDYLGRTYPDICSVETIGHSFQKRPLKILKISNGNENNTAIWIDGGMHAREWISPSAVTFIANKIVEGWEELPDYMKNINWHIHPVANPDGYEYTHTTDRLWRKNLHDHGRECPGVDLNRNFGYMWGGKGSSANPCSSIYRGSRAFSEPETFYISKYLSSFPRGSFGGYLSFHSYGQYILYPWGFDYTLTEDKVDLDKVARKAATSITKLSGAKYTVGSSGTTLYPAAGGSDDWAKGFAGIKYSYTVEMGDTGRYGFVLPAKYIENNVKDAFIFAETVAHTLTKESHI